jgi:DNA-binding response OmpR family regulator
MDHGKVASVQLTAPEMALEARVLDADARCIRGIEMDPLLSGEFSLLAFLGSRPRVWHASRVLAASVYKRDDPAGVQLVWKYASTLRKKLRVALPGLLEVCRRRGYRCGIPLRIVSSGTEQTLTVIE